MKFLRSVWHGMGRLGGGWDHVCRDYTPAAQVDRISHSDITQCLVDRLHWEQGRSDRLANAITQAVTAQAPAEVDVILRAALKTDEQLMFPEAAS